ncbi:MAG TPA: EamA family transporter [Clostridiaceae bacterium]|nr:EamA family transporter [Clostridiaceae bacterium]
MGFAMIWPIALIVISNIFYNICSKETPAAINPFASLTVTYIVGAVVSLVLYFTINKSSSFMQELKGINWSSFVLGLAIVGLEAGSIFMYKAGWQISSGHIVHSIILTICLVFVGALIYREVITITKIAGILICMFGLYLINK